MSDYIKQNSSEISFTNSENWVILNPIELSIKKKIEQYGTKLQDWDLSINRGILTGYNDAFIIDEATKNSLITADPKSAELIRPILRGKDIKRYSYNFANLYLICTFPSKHYNIDDYPAIKKYLLSFDKRRLAQTGEKNIDGIKGFNARKKTGNKWFETQDQINYSDDFYNPKIMYNDINTRLSFCCVEQGIFCNNTVYFLQPNEADLKYFLAILNSRIINWYYKTLSVQLGSNAVRMFSIYVKKIPIPQINMRERMEISDLVNKELSNKNMDDIIDNKIYQLFHLSDYEIEYINHI